MQKTNRKNKISNIGDYSLESNYLNLEKIHDFKEMLDEVIDAVKLIGYHSEQIDRIYRWLEREERRLVRDVQKEKRPVQ